MQLLGFKELTPENYLQIDDVMKGWVTVEPQGQVDTIQSAKWAEAILSINLAECVPAEVQRLFHVARGTMLYGFYFYPLYTLGYEQLLRAADTAASMRCSQLDALVSLKPLKERIDWLRGQGILTEDEAGCWHALRGLRNSASHPIDQTIITPGMAIDTMQRVAEDVNRLFASS